VRTNRVRETLATDTEWTTDAAYALPAVGAAAVVVAAYLATHPYPGLGGGLFSAMAEAVRAHGYRLPTTIPHYTADGLPFAYPPLGVYLLAALGDLTGLGPLALTRIVPGVFVLCYAVGAFAFAREFLPAPTAGVAAVAVATSPVVLTMNVTAGGVVRAPAFALLAVGLAAGTRLFRTRRPQWVAVGAAVFGLVVALHPIAALSFGLGYLFLYAALDRTLAGLARGAAVAAGGLALASPWLVTVVSRHGVEVFLRAAGTHGGVAPDLLGPAKFLYVPRAVFPTVWLALVVVGGVILVARRRLLLPAWFAVFLLVAPGRATMLVGSLLAAVGVVEAAAAATRGASWLVPVSPAAFVVAVVCLFGTGVGAMHAADYPGLDDQHVTQAYVDDAHLDAMAWVRAETPPDATFVVVGDVAEWFPLFAERTSLVTFRGTEWEGAAVRGRHARAKAALAECDAARCLTRALAEYGFEPDYLYVPVGSYSAGYEVRRQSSVMARSLAADDRYRVVHRTESALVVRVGRPPDAHEPTGPSREPSNAPP
jgi:hypothetical protein